MIIHLYAHCTVRNSDLNYQITLGDRKGTLNRNVTTVRNIRCQPLISLTYNGKESSYLLTLSVCLSIYKCGQVLLFLPLITDCQTNFPVKLTSCSNRRKHVTKTKNPYLDQILSATVTASLCSNKETVSQQNLCSLKIH